MRPIDTESLQIRLCYFGSRALSGASGLYCPADGRRSTRLPLENLPDLVGLALADNQLERVAERDVPALAAERRQLTDVVHIHDSVAVYPLKLSSAQAVPRLLSTTALQRGAA